jgi:prolyl 4-hydroxylase
MTSPAPSLAHYLRVYDADLDATTCADLIATFQATSRQHRVNGAGAREGLDDSKWTELNVTQHADAAFLGFFRRKIDAALAAYNRDVGLRIAIPNSAKTSDLVLKHYRNVGDEKFQLHFDSIYEKSNRYLVMLWYLNDVAAGGETAFPDLGIQVRPAPGRLIVFPPYWMFQHAGLPPISGDKYILSTYLLFEPLHQAS